MNLSDYLTEESISINPEISDKSSLLRSIASLAKKNSILKNVSGDEIFEKLLNREKLGSTGFGNKIAIPHCSLEGISDFVLGIITMKDGIDFDSLDKKKTHLFFFIIAPSDKRNIHISFLSAISSLLRVPEAVNEILVGNDPGSIQQSLIRHSPEKKIITGKQDHNILHIFIQNEGKFEDILNILTEVIDVNISVLESNNARGYLYSLPLFSSFWNNEEKGFQRLIIAVMEKSRTNDTLRKINMIIDSSGEDPGILILMQNIDYINGSINI